VEEATEDVGGGGGGAYYIIILLSWYGGVLFLAFSRRIYGDTTYIYI